MSRWDIAYLSDLVFELHYLIRRTPNNVTQLFQSQHSDIFVLRQRIQGSVIDTRFQQMVL